MALTKSFKDLVQRRAAAEPGFGEALLREGVEAVLSGDVNAGKPKRTTSSGQPRSPVTTEADVSGGTSSIHLTAEDQRALAASLSNPASPNEALVRATRTHRQLIRR